MARRRVQGRHGYARDHLSSPPMSAVILALQTPPVWMPLSICASAIGITALVVRALKIAPDRRSFRFLLLGLSCVALIKLVLSPMLLYHARSLKNVIGDVDPARVLWEAAVIVFVAYAVGLWLIAAPSLNRANREAGGSLPA